MRFMKWLVLGMVGLTVAGNVALFVLAFRYQWIPDAMAYGFSLAVPIELAVSGLMRIMEGKNGNQVSDAQQVVQRVRESSTSVYRGSFNGGWADQSDDAF